MKIIKLYLFTCFICSTAFGQNSNPIYYQTITKDKNLYYLEQNNGVFTIYQMGKHFDHHGANSGYAIRRIDTLSKVAEQNYVGKFSKLTLGSDNTILEVEKNKTLQLVKADDSNLINTNLNNAYCLEHYFELSAKINNKFPLYDYSFRNGYDAWEAIQNKSCNHREFIQNLDTEIGKLEDSISNQQNKYTNTTNYLLNNLEKLEYLAFKDSLSTLPIEWRTSSYYFGTVVNEVSKRKPEYFFRIAEDFPANRNIVFSAVEDDKKVINALKLANGNEKVKKEFFKDRKFGKTLIYRVVGTYAVFAGLITWLIVAQR